MYSFVDIFFKHVACALSILQSDHLLTVSILFFLALILVVSLFLTVLFIETTSTLSPLSTIHHSPLHLTSPSILQSYSFSKTIVHTFHHIVPLEDIIWLSFNSVTTFFGSLLYLWPGGTVAYFRFETNLHHHRIASFFSKSTLPQHTTLLYLLHHFKSFKNICSSSPLETQKQCIHHDKNTRTLKSRELS